MSSAVIPRDALLRGRSLVKIAGSRAAQQRLAP